MTKSTWKILKLDWKTPGIFFFQKSGNPITVDIDNTVNSKGHFYFKCTHHAESQYQDGSKCCK